MDSTRRDQLKHDMSVEWWRASEADNFNLKDKLLRVGCRPLKRKLLACKVTEGSGGNYQPDKYYECQKIKNDIQECYKALQYLQLQVAQQQITERESLRDKINE